MSGAGAAPESDLIERDLERTRARLDATLDALQHRLSPNAMVDQAMGLVKGGGDAGAGGGGDIGRTLALVARENPIPAALVGLGLAWLLLKRRGGTATRRRPPRSTTTATTTDRGRSPSPVTTTPRGRHRRPGTRTGDTTATRRHPSPPAGRATAAG